MPAKTIADAHREAACSLISARWGQQIATAVGASTDRHDEAEAAAEQRIQDLTVAEAPPGDVIDYVDAFFDGVHSTLNDERERLEQIVSDPNAAALLYPVVAEVDPAASLALIVQRIDTLEVVWTPGGGV
jgi:hypothetical protein